MRGDRIPSAFADPMAKKVFENENFLNRLKAQPETWVTIIQSRGAPQVQTRYISIHVRTPAMARAHGRRCDAKTALEFDHAIPRALGGDSSLQNIRVLCKTHNMKKRFRSWEQRNAQFLKTESKGFVLLRGDVDPCRIVTARPTG